MAVLQPADNSAPKSDTTPARIADMPAGVNAPAISSTRTIREQVVAAITLAEHVTAATSAPTPEQQSNDASLSDHAEGAQSSDAAKTADAKRTAPVSPGNGDNLVALLMARPEIGSVSDLAGKDIAIEDGQSASSASVRTAIAAAGAAEAQLSESHAKAIDRLVGGEVPAAVLALVSSEAAEWFPEIKGFKVFRIPLSPRS
jgi:ABC-type phosphate/phosphonate transport system substrate-binding protein